MSNGATDLTPFNILCLEEDRAFSVTNAQWEAMNGTPFQCPYRPHLHGQSDVLRETLGALADGEWNNWGAT